LTNYLADPISATLHPAGSRIACTIEYDGGPYNGWQAQSQPHAVTVQGELERALAYVADGNVDQLVEKLDSVIPGSTIRETPPPDLTSIV